jgi:hypothetical protein
MAQISPSVPEGVNEKAGILRIATDRDKTNSGNLGRLLRLGAIE